MPYQVAARIAHMGPDRLPVPLHHRQRGMSTGHRDYWASFELPRMFGHLWSLAIEEQFYLLWPFALLLLG